jgi:hypothetical protein
MADAVTSQTIQDGPKLAIMRFTNLSDGTGEGTAVKKVDVSALAPLQGKGGEAVCDEVRIRKIQFTTSGMPVRLLWDADTDAFIMNLPAGVSDTFDCEEIGGLKNTKATGWTGDINFLVTAALADAGDSYDVTLWLEKKYAGS